MKESRSLCSQGGFNLHKYISNDKDVINSLPQEIRAKNIQNIDLNHDQPPVDRTLGIEWCVESDNFQFRIHLKDQPLFRRGILSTISSIFDPLSLVVPFLLQEKKILQELCVENKGWDDPICDEVRIKWEK